MPYTPPAWMNMGAPAFGSLAPQNPAAALGQQPGGQGAQVPGGVLGAISSAMQGNPTGGLAKQLFGQPQAPAPGAAPGAPPQMGLLTGLMQKLGMGGAGAGAGAGASGPGGISPTALTGLW